MKLLTCVALFFLALISISVLLITKCTISLDEVSIGHKGMLFTTDAHNSYKQFLEEKGVYLREKESLIQEIELLRHKLSEYVRRQHNGTCKCEDCSIYLGQQVGQAELTKGVSLNNEYEVLPYALFTLVKLYPTELGLGKRMAEKPVGFKKKDLLEGVAKGIEVLNKDRLGARYSNKDFVEGLYRIDPVTGTQYELFFKEKLNNSVIVDNGSATDSSSTLVHVSIMRPFYQMLPISVKFGVTNTKMVNIILPLSGRVTAFKNFMDKFINIIVKHDRNVFLTVVYFGHEGLVDIRTVLTHTSRGARFRNMKLLTLNETFSRGKGLQVGSKYWQQGDVILFMCDVDIAFSHKFLSRCRLNASPGVSVYYPIVFSLYNPNLVYTANGKDIPQELNQLVISKDTGFWRDFGFGMTCQYRSDFLKIKGFDESIVGWGFEDVLLYRKYVRSSIKVIRSTDPGIYHLWHSKLCDPGLKNDQYQSCLRSKALNEASHAQLGLLAFKDDLSRHRELHLGKPPHRGA